jgi:hypothetical protein
MVATPPVPLQSVNSDEGDGLQDWEGWNCFLIKVESLAQSERLISPGVPSVSEPNVKRTQGKAERGRVWGGDVPLAIEPPVEPLSALP